MPSLPVEWNSNDGAGAGMIEPMRFDYSDKNPELGNLYGRHVETIRRRGARRHLFRRAEIRVPR